MSEKYQIRVFGKEGCAKCHTLNQRLDKLLLKDSFSSFKKNYCDVETVEGLVAFAEAECVNPSRIPAVLICFWDDNLKEYTPISRINPGAPCPTCKKSRLYHYIGLQTDYSGNGVISPKMLQTVLLEALETCPA